MNEGGAAWMIHPASFKLFKVETVPSIVLADASSASLLDNGCAQETTYTKITGDITLDSALDVMSRRAEPGFAKLAKKLMAENQGKYKPGSILSR
jgi:conjugal transfer pilus assembly protein TrbC